MDSSDMWSPDSVPTRDPWVYVPNKESVFADHFAIFAQDGRSPIFHTISGSEKESWFLFCQHKDMSVTEAVARGFQCRGVDVYVVPK